jgi:hypothetical protein
MRRRGLIRLWVVASAVFVPGVALWAVNDSMDTWARIDRMTIERCVNEETADPRTDATKCVHREGADQDIYAHEYTSPGRYWSEALGFSFLFDLIITALLVGAFLVGRWVVRGFKAEA